MLKPLLVSMGLLACQATRAEILFSDGFEGGVLKPQWTVSKTNDGKVSIRSDFAPASGSGHLVFEDTVNDAVYSSALATLSLDLSNKKNVVLTFKAKSLGNEPHEYWFGTDQRYDGVSVSPDGGLSWIPVGSLAWVGNEWEEVSIILDDHIRPYGYEFASGFLIRFSEYDNAGPPVDGIAIDDVSVSGSPDQRVILEMPAGVTEGDGPLTGYALLAIPSAEPVTVTFSQGTLGQFMLPGSIVFPPGETMVAFTFSVADDALVNLGRDASVDPVAEGITPVGAVIHVRDNEPKPVISFSLPATLQEGSYPTEANASISISAPAARDLEFALGFDPSGWIYPGNYDYYYTIPAGQTKVEFNLRVLNNTSFDGNVAVGVTAECPALGKVTGRTTAIDDEVPPLALQLPESAVEGSTFQATVKVPVPLAESTAIYLSADETKLLVPAWVIIPAGGTSAVFGVTVVDDSLKNLTRNAVISLEGYGFENGQASITILDDEPAPVVTLSIPGRLLENAPSAVNSSISISEPVGIALSFQVAAAPAEELSLPASVVIPAGQTTVGFSTKAVDDSRIDGDIPVAVTLSTASLPPVTARTLAVDDEEHVFTVYPLGMAEGTKDYIYINLPGTLREPLAIHLASTDPDRLSMPSNVVLPAGSSAISVPVAAIQNAVSEGASQVDITLSAPSFVSKTFTVTIRDNDAAGYEFYGMSGLVDSSKPWYLTVFAVDAKGVRLNEFDGGVLALSLVLPDGSVMSLERYAIMDRNGYWEGAVQLPAGLTGYGYRFRLTDNAGGKWDSKPFDLMRSLNILAKDLVWDGARNRIYASVAETTGPNPNRVVAINPATLEITGSVNLSLPPGQLALTSGNEFLYVVEGTNGSIRKIDPAAMSAVSTFTVGSDPYYGLLGVSDISTVAGSPNLLVVSRTRKNNTPAHAGVAVYDNGVMRSVVTANGMGSSSIEPSADPAVFFGHNGENNESGFRLLKIGANGVTQTAVANGLITYAQGYPTTIRSDGDKVFSTFGDAINGPSLVRVGGIGTYGPVRPDAATGRVYSLSLYDRTINSNDINQLGLVASVPFAPLNWESASLIRWGANGLAFRDNYSIKVIDNPWLVPGGPATDLVVQVSAPSAPAVVGEVVTYQITLTNEGENTATGTLLTAAFSEGLAISEVSPANGSVAVVGRDLRYPCGDLAPGASATVFVSVKGGLAGRFLCTARGATTAIDPALQNNIATSGISIGLRPVRDVFSKVRFSGRSMASDPSRGLLWATTSSEAVEPYPSNSLVSIDPATGLISEPIPLPAESGAMALSENGRYLYIGFSERNMVRRLDLSASPPAELDIPLAAQASDIEVLHGDGTSFMVVDYNRRLTVIDGNYARGAGLTVPGYEIEATADPAVFVGRSYSSDLYLLTVGSAGVSQSPVFEDLLPDDGYGHGMTASGNLLLGGGGHLVNTASMTAVASLHSTGVPCADAVYRRAYLADAERLRAFDAVTGELLGGMPFSQSAESERPSVCVRWGIDGLAVLWYGGDIQIIRCSVAVPDGADGDHDGIPDEWVARNFTAAKVDLHGDTDGDGIPDAMEYLFRTSPSERTRSPFRLMSVPTQGGREMKIRYPRRVGIDRSRYIYEVSTDMLEWSQVPAEESVQPAVMSGDGGTEEVEAVLAMPDPSRGFARVRWKP